MTNISREEYILGIDLGTSNSAAAVVINKEVVMIRSSDAQAIGGKSHRSYVAITKKGELLIGEAARKQIFLNPEGTVKNIKRRMGQKIKITLAGKDYYPEQISGMLLQKIKEDAEKFLNKKITKAVITVPAYYNEQQRQATKDAGTIAGLEVLRIINERTAAALSYGLDKQKEKKVILVFDIGGGTLDVTIMALDNGIFEVLSTSGDTKLGGTDMDLAMMEIIKEKLQKYNYDYEKDIEAYTRVREMAEKVKIELSVQKSSNLILRYLAVKDGKPINVDEIITKEEFIEKINPIIEKCTGPLSQAIKDAKIDKNKLDEVLLVGGRTRMRIVKEYLERYFNKKILSTIDRMECVAQGAAIQGAILKGDISGLVLIDVTRLTLGVELVNSEFSPIISRNTAIPIEKTNTYSTLERYQRKVQVNVYQGERALVQYNNFLGSLVLEINPQRRRVSIDVTFEIDSNGLLKVRAKETETGKEISTVIKQDKKFTQKEIEAMVKDAEENLEKDKKAKEEKEKEYYIGQVEKEYSSINASEVSGPEEEKEYNHIKEKYQKVKEMGSIELQNLLAIIRQLKDKLQKGRQNPQQTRETPESPRESEEVIDPSEVNR